MQGEPGNLKNTIEQVSKEKGINRAILVDTLESAMLTAARKKLGMDLNLEARYNEENGEVELFKWVRVVPEVKNPNREISLDDARKRLDPGCSVDDELGEKLDTRAFGRIAAQTAKQVIIQKVRDAERAIVYKEYKDRKGELVTGIVRRFERQDIIVDLGRAEASLSRKEQISKETYRTGDRIQAYILDVNKEGKGPIISLSRTDEGLLIKLFEMEVPEIYEGIVRIVSAAREPGVRAKIAVSSRDHDVDPVGACVGVKGARVQAVVQELRGEKIDIVPYSEDPARFVCNAIAPAQVTRVIIDQENTSMELIVPDDQQSLAIGRKGQNVRLAAKLTGWNIDIHSESDVARAQEQTYRLMSQIEGVTKDMLDTLFKLGYRSAEDLVRAEAADLAIIPGIGTDKATLIKNAAENALEMLQSGQIPPELLEEETEPKSSLTVIEGEALVQEEPSTSTPQTTPPTNPAEEGAPPSLEEPDNNTDSMSETLPSAQSSLDPAPPSAQPDHNSNDGEDEEDEEGKNKDGDG